MKRGVYDEGSLMPRVLPKPRWKDDEVVVAWCALVGDTYSIAKGERLRASDVRVRLHPNVFVAGDTPPSEWPSEVDWAALPSTPELAADEDPRVGFRR